MDLSLGRSELGWIVIVLYGLLVKIEIGFCGAGWYGISWLVVSLLGKGWAVQCQ